MRRKIQSRPSTWRYTEEIFPDVISMYNDWNISTLEICKRFGFSSSTLSRILRDCGQEVVRRHKTRRYRYGKKPSEDNLVPQNCAVHP